MAETRRARPTIRCLTEDLELDLPELSVDLGTLDHPWIDEVRRVAPSSPVGQKRILSIQHPLVYRLRVSSERGATWLDEDGTVWLCAVRRREEGSDDDAFDYFAELHAQGRLLPTEDDRLRERAELAVGLFHRLRRDLVALVELARSHPSEEQAAELDSWLPARTLSLVGDVEEIWCAVSVRATDGTFLRAELRDLLFAALEEELSPVLFEARDDWPTGTVEWFEAVRLGLR